MNDKNILLLSDLEGIIGVYNFDDPELNKNLYLKEISIIFDTIMNSSNGSSYNIYYCDIHDNGSMGLLLQDKYPNVHFVKEFMNIDFNVHYDAAFLTGLHARCKTDGILCHSFRNDFSEVYLGDKVVGELEIYINWISYFGIPTTFVSCDDVAMEELSNINCIKNISKSRKNVLNNYSIDKRYEELTKNILLALENSNPIATKYNNDNVRICFDESHIIKGLDRNQFNIVNKSVVFKDTVDFVDKLMPLAIDLNKIMCEEYNNNVNFINKLRNEYSHVKVENITDERFNKIINSNFSTLEEDERQYVLDILSQYV